MKQEKSNKITYLLFMDIQLYNSKTRFLDAQQIYKNSKTEFDVWSNLLTTWQDNRKSFKCEVAVTIDALR